MTSQQSHRKIAPIWIHGIYRTHFPRAQPALRTGFPLDRRAYVAMRFSIYQAEQFISAGEHRTRPSLWARTRAELAERRQDMVQEADQDRGNRGSVQRRPHRVGGCTVSVACDDDRNLFRRQADTIAPLVSGRKTFRRLPPAPVSVPPKTKNAPRSQDLSAFSAVLRALGGEKIHPLNAPEPLTRRRSTPHRTPASHSAE